MLKNFWADEEGSVLVWTAVAMIVLIGFTSLVVDVGSMMNERSLLQNAADAAALAGVAQEEADQEAVAKQYVLTNTTGVNEEDITVTRLENGDLKVEIVKDSEAFFSRILTGSNTNRVGAVAVATLKDVINMANIAIWSANEIKMGNNSVVYGSVYSDTGYFNFKGKVTIEGERLSQGQSMPNYSHLLDTSYTNTHRVSKAFLDTNCKNAGGYHITDGTVDLLREIDGSSEAIFYFDDVYSDIIIDAGLAVNIISNGDIVFNGSGVTADAMILYSVNGNVTFNGAHPDLRILLYAPNGNVEFNGQGVVLKGSVIGQNVIANGNKTTVTFTNTGIESPVVPKPRLVE